MQTQPNPIPQPQFPLLELEQIEAAIQASTRWLNTLQGRREVLTAELEKITRPPVAPTKPAMKTVGPGLEYLGKMTHHWNYIDIHIDLLRRLWTEFPERRDAMAQAMGVYGNTRVYVARSVEALFPGQPLPWAQRYSRQLVEGWYVDTNLNSARACLAYPPASPLGNVRCGLKLKP